ncbi:hypothetical protein [Vibrio sp. V39_P1S14PM300]|uniref:hypothetical protein n=1 Tax=Vibrio sp. V39_P1S14PM300 TaxID=1938690 RepID=UPI0013722F8D|nr:hypothetical protein [Vibrio sp. V39_P1S14PM300]NAX20632.1 hypothetical protein [Vibrio sp. V39_P1S14PM300]
MTPPLLFRGARLAWLFMALAVSACSTTPTAYIAAYSKDATQVTSRVQTLIDDYNRSARNEELATLTTSPHSVTKDALAGAARSGLPDINAVALFQANQALHQYAQSLFHLSMTASDQAVALASVELIESLNTLNKSYEKLQSETLLTQDQSATGGRVIGQLSATYLQNKRADAIKAVVMDADPLVQELTERLAADILRQDFIRRLEIARDTELSLYLTAVNNTSRSDLLRRHEAVEQSYDKYSAMMASLASVEATASALREMARAHHVIATEVAADRFTSDALKKSVSELHATHKMFASLEEMMQTCPNQIVVGARSARCPE